MNDINLVQLLSSLSFSISLAESSAMSENKVIEAVSNIDYSAHKFQHHSARTAYVAMQIGLQISEDIDFLRMLFISSTMHDIGAAGSNNDIHSDNKFILLHCIRGSKFIEKLPIKNSILDIIKYHHENYNGSGNFGLKGDEIPLISQIIRVADTFELLYDEAKPNYFQRMNIMSWLENQKGILFSPYLVDTLNLVQTKDAFWWDVENIDMAMKSFDILKSKLYVKASISDLKNIAELFAEIIDTKSPFTFTHSTNLSKLILKASLYLGFDDTKKSLLEIAALLHDIGKLYIPNSILDKPGKLNNEEYTIMKSHTYFTRLILSKVDSFEDITTWSSNHHEKLNGRGYPYCIGGDNLSLEERLMAVCDIYEALTADRPYRKGMEKHKALSIIHEMVAKGELCSKSVQILEEII